MSRISSLLIFVTAFLMPLPNLEAQTANNAPTQTTSQATSAGTAAPAPGPPAPPAATSLSQVKRIYVDSFGDDPISKQIQSMVAATLAENSTFVVTENKDKADAILKGAGLEKTSQEVHAYNEATSAGGAAGGYSRSGSFGHGGFASRSAAIDDASLNTETVNNARVAVRLVNRDGDVIWATTQESHGAKYKGASADVADMVVKKLLRDLQKSKKSDSPVSAASQ